MARKAARGFWSHVRALAGTARRCLAAAPLAAAIACAVLNAAYAEPAPEPVKGEATFAEANGFARLVLKLDHDVASDVTTAGSIVIIRFERPVDISVDALGNSVPSYVASARRDPDGMAIRLSLARRVTINTMSAAGRTFVYFLPGCLTGPPPPLPTEVVHELAERAR